VDSGDASNIPVRSYGDNTETNYFGKAVVTDVNDYVKNKVSVNIKDMPENAEVSSPVSQIALTEGAIGYKSFNVVSGAKGMALIKLRNGDNPPFGSIVTNSNSQQVGIVSDDGEVYLSGLKSFAEMQVSWNGAIQCKIKIPELKNEPEVVNELFLPCS
ncbi:TPA: fimbria/pilus outer membrane usher protein, partial [Enterobacter asburiae]|nr:fimbria/pilus outer membrane usher protein [Enterobacter asburiae]